MEPTYLGLELGSTRIKAITIDHCFQNIASGNSTWASTFENGIWTYPLEQVWPGMQKALSQLPGRENICAMGISAMMHGYLAFDRDWNLLVPFRTWQNTTTAQAAEELTKAFHFNIPQRWSVAHLYQAVLNGEPHVDKIAHITTLAGYVHYRLTGVNAVGIGEASGMFPIDSAQLCYDRKMLRILDGLLAEKDLPWKVEALLPEVLPAGKPAGRLTEEGAMLLGGLLPAGIPLAPPEGDAGTGMTATNSVTPGTGNVSAGTSIFAMVVLEKQLSHVHPEIDMVTTPTGKPVAMVHCNNCTNDMNAWAAIFRQCLETFDCRVDDNTLFTKLYEKSLEGEPDCSGITVYNYLAGEPIMGLAQGTPMVLRSPGSNFSLANFLRAQLYSTVATLAMGLEILKQEQVPILRLTGHGGLFKTPVVGQKYLAAAANCPVWVMETASEGGAYGMALLAAFLLVGHGLSLEAFLSNKVFANANAAVLTPTPEDRQGLIKYLARFWEQLPAERAAVSNN